MPIPPLGYCAECCNGCRWGGCEAQNTHQGGSGHRAGHWKVLDRKGDSGFEEVRQGHLSWGPGEGSPWSQEGQAGLWAASEGRWGLGFRPDSQQEGKARGGVWGEWSLVDFSKDPSGGWWENSPGVGGRRQTGIFEWIIHSRYLPHTTPF